MKKITTKSEKTFPVRLVFLLDIVLTALSFVASYFICSLILPDLGGHAMLVQLPIVVALTSIIFLAIGIYKGYVKFTKIREVYSIFNAICITNILTIVLVVVNGTLFMEKNLMVPLSIIIVHSILSFSVLVISRYAYKYASRFNKAANSAKSKLVFAHTSLLSVSQREATEQCLKNAYYQKEEDKEQSEIVFLKLNLEDNHINFKNTQNLDGIVLESKSIVENASVYNAIQQANKPLYYLANPESSLSELIPLKNKLIESTQEEVSVDQKFEKLTYTSSSLN